MSRMTVRSQSVRSCGVCRRERLVHPPSWGAELTEDGTFPDKSGVLVILRAKGSSSGRGILYVIEKIAKLPAV